MVKNILWDTSKGDVTEINGMNIGQTTPGKAVFTTMQATTIVGLPTTTIAVANVTATAALRAGALTVTGTMLVTGNATLGANATVVGYLSESIAPAVSAMGTTNTFAAAVALTAQINVITAVTFTSGSPVALPSVGVLAAAAEAPPISIFNQTTMTVGVWPQSTDIIDVASTGVGILLAAGKRAQFVPISPTKWISAQYGVTSA